MALAIQVVPRRRSRDDGSASIPRAASRDYESGAVQLEQERVLGVVANAKNRYDVLPNHKNYSMCWPRAETEEELAHARKR